VRPGSGTGGLAAYAIKKAAEFHADQRSLPLSLEKTGLVQ
jgi:hypothetical protein